MSQSRGVPKTLAVVGLTVLVSALLAAGLTAVLLVAVDRADRPMIEVEVANQPTVVVQIGGAVATPGVYTLPGGARLQDAIVAAGGLASDANPSSLNLAARVGDGESITVESLGRATEPPAAAGGELAVVNINTATLEELDSLPGIGPVIGERIIAYREEHGPFVTVDGLIEVEGISANLLERLRLRITVDG